MGGGEEGMGQGQNKMGRLPQAVEQEEARGSQELVVSLYLHDQLISNYSPNAHRSELIRGYE